MLSRPSTRVRARSRALALAFFLLTAFGLSTLVAPVPEASAMTTYQYNVMREAKRHQGKPYQWGAVGPYRFDCSGYTLYVFKRFGKSLPHNAARQYSSIRHVGKSYKRVGDLIFTRNSSGSIYHVGIYAGNNKMWHSPRSGSYVKLSSMWSTNYVVGRP